MQSAECRKMQDGTSFTDYEPVTSSASEKSSGGSIPSFTDYEPVTPARRSRLPVEEQSEVEDRQVSATEIAIPVEQRAERKKLPPQTKAEPDWFLRHGHSFTYAGLFLFTVVLYYRPYDFFPTIVPSTIAFFIALLTLAFFLPSQLILENRLTTRPREVNLALLLCLAAALSMPLALNRAESWETFSNDLLKAVVMFIVMVNVVRTELRLRLLLWLVLSVSCFLAVNALNDYRMGVFAVEGYRVGGAIGGMFRNPNDMALHLVTIVPIALVLFFSTRNLFMKGLYAAAALSMMGGIVVTFSRGAFLGLAAALAVLLWKIGRRNRLTIAVAVIFLLAAFAALAPSSYYDRLATIGDPHREANGSALARRAVLFRSINVALHHPVLGVGIGNFHIVSIKELVTHNAYTQVAAEMGLTAMAIYILFIVTPLRRLREIERETFSSRRSSKFYYLAIGLQASLVGYMVSSFFGAVAYQYYIYYLVGYAVCLRRIYAASPDARAAAQEQERAASEVAGENVPAGLAASLAHSPSAPGWKGV